MASYPFPPAPPPPPPFHNAASFPPQQGPQGPVSPHNNSSGPQSNGLPIGQFANMQINPNAQRNRPEQSGQRMEIPIRYEGVTLRKDLYPPSGDEPSWMRVLLSPMSDSSGDLSKQVSKRSKDSVQKELKKLKSDKQRDHIDRLIENKRLSETNPNASWVIASVEEERGPRRNGKETETKAIHVIMKRYPKSKPNNIKGKGNYLQQNNAYSSVQDLNLPARSNMGPSQGPQAPFPRGPFQGQVNQNQGPHYPQGAPNVNGNGQNFNGNGQNFNGNGQNFNANGQRGFPNPQMPNASQVPPPPPMGSHQMPSPPMGGQPRPPNASFNDILQGHLNKPQQPKQGFPQGPGPIQIPKQGATGQHRNQHSMDSEDEIIQVVGGTPPLKSKHVGKNHNRRPSTEKDKASNFNHRNSNVSFNTLSDDDDSSQFSPGEEEFTNITTPTSGTGSLPRGSLARSSLPRGLGKPKAGLQRRNTDVDYLTERRQYERRDRRPSYSRRLSRGSDDLLDDYLQAGPYGDRSHRDRRESLGSSRRYIEDRPYYGSRSMSEALYKPERSISETERLDQLLRLERMKRDEDAKLDQLLLERKLYEEERDYRRYGNGIRPGRYDEFNSPRYDRRRRDYYP